MPKSCIDINNIANEYNQMDYMIRSIIGSLWTACPVKVVTVTPPHFVDVLPLIKQVDGEKNAIDTEVLYNLPYSRLQCGLNAVIVDPKPGDIGWCVFAQRDISVLKETKTAAPVQVGSFRQFDPSDGIYLGGILNQPPVRYIEIKDDAVLIQGNSEQISIETNGEIKIKSAQSITLDAPQIFVTGVFTQTGARAAGVSSSFANDVIAEEISLAHHIHRGVEQGNDNTGQPV